MLLGFKRRFAPFVEDGSKTHTIRSKRKYLFQVGSVCACYVDTRQKTMRLLGRWLCVKVEEIEITGDFDLVSEEFYGTVTIDGIRLSEDECNHLAWIDGFRSNGPFGAFSEMLEYWQGRLPFKGYVIHWDHSKPISPAVAMFCGRKPKSRKTRAKLKELATASIQCLKQMER